jgi:SAM-dependent methyltransferase
MDAIIGARLEHPDFLPRQRRYPVQGWVVSRKPVLRVQIEGTNSEPLFLRPRPDVEKTITDAPYAVGFHGSGRIEHVKNGALTLRFEFDGSDARRQFAPPKEDTAALEQRFQRLDRVYDVLACPRCTARFPGGGFSRDAVVIRCADCGSSYSCSEGFFDLLSDDQSDLSLRDDGAISQNNYDERALAFVEEGRAGLLLDCGAGHRPVEYPHVVNLETVPYRSTDVLGDNQRLPFADDSFDGVLSLAVLEHVRDPFAAAREICRVLKPGGKVLAVVPLIAPVHAFPHHYFNMTSEGLVNLFGPAIEVVETAVPETGLPIWALVWSLRSWAEGLKGLALEDFLDLRVRDLLGEAPRYLTKDFVRKLSREKNFELASTTLLLGKKK